MRLYRSELTRSNDTADTLLKRLGIDDPAAASHLRSDNLARQSLLGRGGRNVRVEADDEQPPAAPDARAGAADDDGNFKRLVVEKTDKGFTSSIETAPLVASTRLVSGVIQSSLFAATDDARIPDPVADPGGRDLLRRHRLPPRAAQGRPLLHRLRNPRRRRRAAAQRPRAEHRIRQQRQDLPGHVVPGTGGQRQARHRARAATTRSTARACAAASWPRRWSFRASPAASRCAFTRSCKTWRAHLGVDYAAPTGTPVRTRRRRRGRICRRAERLRQCRHGRPPQPEHDGVCPPEPHQRQARPDA